MIDSRLNTGIVLERLYNIPTINNGARGIKMMITPGMIKQKIGDDFVKP